MSDKITNLLIELEMAYNNLDRWRRIHNKAKAYYNKSTNYDVMVLKQGLSKKDKLLTAKDAEIARLKVNLRQYEEGDKTILEMCQEIQPERHALTLTGYIAECFLLLQATIKEREAEAKSYRDLYNELKGAVLEDVALTKHEYEITHKDVLHKIQDLKEYMEKYEIYIHSRIVTGFEIDRKYRRLVDLLRRENDSGYCDAEYILAKHRELEDKLKKRRGK